MCKINRWSYFMYCSCTHKFMKWLDSLRWIYHCFVNTIPIKWPTEQKFWSYSNDQYNKFNALQFQFFTSKLVLDVSKLARLKLPAHTPSPLNMSPPNRLLGHFLFHIYASTHTFTPPHLSDWSRTKVEKFQVAWC